MVQNECPGNIPASQLHIPGPWYTVIISSSNLISSILFISLIGLDTNKFIAYGRKLSCFMVHM